MKVILEIQRFNPERDPEPHFQSFEVEVEPSDRVLDALMEIKNNKDGSLAFRRSCAHGVCGSDAMVINGREALACKTLIQDVASGEGATIRIQPARHMKIQRDLMVDLDDFFAKYRGVKPFLIPDEAQSASGREYNQGIEERAMIDDPTKCILCASCYSACPVLDSNPAFIGPAALVQAGRFIFDSRDQGLGPRLEVLDQPDAVWACGNHFECTKVCPREIKVTRLINAEKRRISTHREERGERVNDGGSSEP